MTTGLVLSGGGARASYQVGVLNAVADILKPISNPFPVICGTSAGAINAALLACESDDFAASIASLKSIWLGLASKDVHEVGGGAIAKSIYTLIRSMLNEGHNDSDPWALLDNAPLQQLLTKVIRFERLHERIVTKDIKALSITALGYTSGASLSFFQAMENLEGWQRHRRIGVPVTLSLEHLMASSAIPGIYKSVLIHREYFGDGAVRQTAPLSPALHLGATKLFVIGVSHNPGQPEVDREKTQHSPSLAQMTSQFLNGSFIDAVEEDLESLSRLNTLIDKVPEVSKAGLELNKVDVMSITPSKRFDDVAVAHLHSLPRSMRTLFKMLGATRQGGGASLASYLLFEADFISELIDCGYQDAIVRREEIKAFLDGDS